MSKKYIIANISFPLKINDDGTYVVLSENTEIKFSGYNGGILSSKCVDKSIACNELSKLMSSLRTADLPECKSVKTDDEHHSILEMKHNASPNTPVEPDENTHFLEKTLKDVVSPSQQDVACSNRCKNKNKNITFKISSKNNLTTKYTMKKH